MMLLGMTITAIAAVGVNAILLLHFKLISPKRMPACAALAVAGFFGATILMSVVSLTSSGSTNLDRAVLPPVMGVAGLAGVLLMLLVVLLVIDYTPWGRANVALFRAFPTFAEIGRRKPMVWMTALLTPRDYLSSENEDAS